MRIMSHPIRTTLNTIAKVNFDPGVSGRLPWSGGLEYSHQTCLLRLADGRWRAFVGFLPCEASTLFTDARNSADISTRALISPSMAKCSGAMITICCFASFAIYCYSKRVVPSHCHSFVSSYLAFLASGDHFHVYEYQPPIETRTPQLRHHHHQSTTQMSRSPWKGLYQLCHLRSGQPTRSLEGLAYSTYLVTKPVVQLSWAECCHQRMRCTFQRQWPWSTFSWLQNVISDSIMAASWWAQPYWDSWHWWVRRMVIHWMCLAQLLGWSVSSVLLLTLVGHRRPPVRWHIWSWVGCLPGHSRLDLVLLTRWLRATISPHSSFGVGFWVDLRLPLKAPGWGHIVQAWAAINMDARVIPTKKCMI